MRITTALILASLSATPTLAKEWQWTAYAIDAGEASIISQGSTCNYQSAISAARKAALASGRKWAIAFEGVDNEVACPKAVKTSTKEQ